MDSSQEQAKAGVAEADSANHQSLKVVAEAINAISTMNSQIAAGQQSNLAAEIDGNVEVLEKVSELSVDSNANAKRISDDELEGLAASLQIAAEHAS